MRTIYLIRHGEPELPREGHLCLSRQDPPLSTVGRIQGALLGAFLRDIPPENVFHSGMLRARETASYLSGAAREEENLQELAMGEWDGLSFSEIRRRYPELYALRGEDPVRCYPPGGEAPEECRRRGEAALRRLLAGTSGDIAVVAHAGLNRLLLAPWMGLPLANFLFIPQPYGCVNVLREEGGRITVDRTGLLPHPALTEEVCEALLEAAGTPEQVRRHCRAVAKKAEELAEGLASAGALLDREALRAACLLHDIARTEPCHPRTGAEWLRQLGYPELAGWIACHHDLRAEQEGEISEASVLYLADKRMEGEREVTLERRFLERQSRFSDPAAIDASNRRYRQAKRVEAALLRAV